MLFCPRCQKEVVIMGVSFGAVPDEDLGKFRDQMMREGKIVLFNPPPFGKYQCPLCSAALQYSSAAKK